MTLNIETYMMDAKHTMTKALRVMSPVIHDVKSAGKISVTTMRCLISFDHYLILENTKS